MEEEKPLTLKQLTEYTKEVLLPATLKQLTEYTTGVLLPAIDFRFGKIDDKISRLDVKVVNLEGKIDNLTTKDEFNEFKNKIYTDIDGLIEKVDKLINENEVRNYQEDKQKEFFAILIKSLKDKNILSEEQLGRIAKLGVL